MTPSTLIGHDDALATMRAALASGRMHHAWLLTGVEGIGKAMLAKTVASLALGGAQNLTAQTRLVEAETHPDLLIIRRPVDEKTGVPKAIIPVDEVLKIGNFIRRTATHGGWRVVIIDEVHRLNRNGQNAILKIVEEPPPATLILMTATTAGALLPTIRSRCRMLPLRALSDDHLAQILREIAPNALDQIAPITGLAGGSAGFALKLLQSDGVALYQGAADLLDAMPALDLARLHKLADQVGRKSEGDNFDVLTALLIERLRQLAARNAVAQGPATAEAAIGIWDYARETLLRADQANLDRKLAFINTMVGIRDRLAA